MIQIIQICNAFELNCFQALFTCNMLGTRRKDIWSSPSAPSYWIFFFWKMKIREEEMSHSRYITSVESQKGTSTIQMFHWEPEGRYHHRMCNSDSPPSSSQLEQLWILIVPFWLSLTLYVHVWIMLLFLVWINLSVWCAQLVPIHQMKLSMMWTNNNFTCQIYF